MQKNVRLVERFRSVEKIRQEISEEKKIKTDHQLIYSSLSPFNLVQQVNYATRLVLGEVSNIKR